MTPRLIDTPVLETERLTLRAPAPQDWPIFAEFMTAPRSQFVRPGDLDIGKIWRAFGHVIGHWVLRGFGMFVFTLKGDDTGLGMAGPWYPAGWPEREIGWSHWSATAEGKGYAFEATAATRPHAFDKLGWDSIVSYIGPGYDRSVELAQRLGAAFDPDAARPDECPECLVYRHHRGTRA